MVKGEGAYGPAYVAAIQRSLIGLGLLSKAKPDTFTTRSFEIPAAGRLLLAERTREHQLLFEEGVEAEFFDDVEELVTRARALLADPGRAMAMAAAGHRRVRENYQWHQVLAPAFDALGLAVPQEARAARANPLEALAA
jgi:spore maturation protein CgeB